MIDQARYAIIGGGPTGSALAAYLARAGEDVLVVDRGVPNLVGESLVPQCAEIFADLGVSMDGFMKKYGAVFGRGSELVRFDFGDALRSNWPHAWQCSREDFDPRFRAAATAAGARYRAGRVRDVRVEECPTLIMADGEIRCERIIDAGGRHQLVARKLGISRTHPTLRNAALCCWHTGVIQVGLEQPGDISVYDFEGGWWWFIPIDDQRTSVGMVATPEGPRGDWEEALRRCPQAALKLARAQALGPRRGAADFSVAADRMHGPGWALVGDAAKFLDPVFSTGILLGLYGARWLSEALLGECTLDEYESRFRKAVAAFEPVIHSYYSGAFLDVSLSQEAQGNDRARQAVVSLLAGDVFDDRFPIPTRVGARIEQLAARINS